MYKMVHDTTSPTNSSFGQLITWSFGSADNLLYYHFVNNLLSWSTNFIDHIKINQVFDEILYF